VRVGSKNVIIIYYEDFDKVEDEEVVAVEDPNK
jgi:hypothetical protein